MLLSFLKNITSYGIQYSLIMILLIMWQMVIGFGLIPDYLLPSPWQIVQAFIDDFYLLMSHAKYTLITAFLGTVIGLVLSFVLSIFMDFSKKFRDIVYPVLLLNQTIPTIAIAPLLVIWLGYGILPKVVLVVLSVFFPMTIALVDGYHSVQKEQLIYFVH